MEINNYSFAQVDYTDCEHESAQLLAVPAKTTVPAGTVLSRSGNGWAIATAADTAVALAVLPNDIANASASVSAVEIRATISGKVRSDKLLWAGSAVSVAQKDLLRGYGIVPVKVTDISIQDNQ